MLLRALQCKSRLPQDLHVIVNLAPNSLARVHNNSDGGASLLGTAIGTAIGIAIERAGNSEGGALAPLKGIAIGTAIATAMGTAIWIAMRGIGGNSGGGAPP